MKLLRDHGLTIVLIAATAGTLIGMIFSGLSVYNDELAQHHRSPMTLSTYMASGHFLSALFENWESEFLQMSAYVALTAFLFQRGSAESKDPDGSAEQDEDPDAHAGNQMHRCPSGLAACRPASMLIPSESRFSPSSS